MTAAPLAFIVATDGQPDKPRLAVRSAFDADLLLRQKQLMPTGRWDRGARVWTWPLTLPSCRRLRDVHGDALQMSQGLADWSCAAIEAERSKEAQRAATLAETARRAERAAAERALFGSVLSDPDATGEPDRDGASASGDDPATQRGDRVARIRSAVRGFGSEALVRVASHDADVPESRFTVPFAAPDDADADWREPLQAAGTAWLHSNRGGAIADDTGLGKTRQVISALLADDRALIGPHLILAPLKPARMTWPDEVVRWTAPDSVDLVPWSDRKRAAAAMRMLRHRHGEVLARPLIVIANHDAVTTTGWLAAGAHEVQWASVVIDEAHEMLSTGWRGAHVSTRRAQAIADLDVIEASDGGMRIACTATPFAGRLINMWGVFDFLCPDGFGTRKAFGDLLTLPGTTEGDDGTGATLDRLNPDAAAEWQRLMGRWVLKRTRSPEMDERVHVTVEIVDPTDDQLAQDNHWRNRELWSGRLPRDVPGLRVHRVTAHDGTSGTVVVRHDDADSIDVVLPYPAVAVTRRIQLSVGEMDGLTDAEICAGARPTYRVTDGRSPKIERVIELLREWGVLTPGPWRHGDTGKVIVASRWTTALDAVEQRIAMEPGLEAGMVCRVDGSSSAGGLTAAVRGFQSADDPRILLLSSKAGGSGITLDQHCTRLLILCEDWIEDTQTQVIGRFGNRTWITDRDVRIIRTSSMLDIYVAHRTAHQRGEQGLLMELASA